jgi:hypothetical protein
MTPRTISCRHLLCVALLALGVLAAPAGAQTTDGKAVDPKKEQAHRNDDIGKHRAIAAAHESAARCLESGQKESGCHEALRKACQGIAVGKYCGMKHSH